LEPSAALRVARALALLVEEINAAPPAIPGDTPAHHLPAHRDPGDLTTLKVQLPEI